MRFNKLIILIILILASCDLSEKKNEQVYSQKELLVDHVVSQDSLLLDRSSGIYYHNNKPFTGRAFSIYENDILSSAIDYKNGKRDGCYEKFFSNGELSYEAHYSVGKLNGRIRSFWRNGNLRTESHFVDGVPHGIQWQYYESGIIFKKMNLVMGKEDGLQQSWRPNGKIYNNYQAKNGRIFGLKRSKLCFKLDDEEVQY